MTSKCGHSPGPLKSCHAWHGTICAVVGFAIRQTHKCDELQKFSIAKLLLLSYLYGLVMEIRF